MATTRPRQTRSDRKEHHGRADRAHLLRDLLRNSDVDPVQWGPSPERAYLQYRAFSEALIHVAVDLHFLASDPSNTKVPASELAIVRHWPIGLTNSGSPTTWSQTRLLDKDGAAALSHS